MPRQKDTLCGKFVTASSGEQGLRIVATWDKDRTRPIVVMVPRSEFNMLRTLLNAAESRFPTLTDTRAPRDVEREPAKRAKSFKAILKLRGRR